MRRAVLTLGGTAAGIATLLAVKFHPGAATMPIAGTSLAPAAGTVPAAAVSGKGTPAGSAAKPSATASHAATASHGTTAGASPAAKPSATASHGGSGGTAQVATARTVDGAVDNTQYGPMQVAITVVGTKITKVTVLQQTDYGGLSSSIDSNAIPQLNSEALAAQSANISAVSGASYTSAGYAQSLQSAIDQAGI